MQRVRLMTWCSSCVGGMHLPAFAAAEGGLFADRGLEVQFVPAARAPDYSLSGFTARVKAVAAGDADLALTSVAYLLAAQTEAAGRLPVRFVAVCHQRNPIVGVVREDSGLHAPRDLACARAARWCIPWYTQEYAGAMEALGLDAPRIVDVPGDLDHALGSGEVDVIPTWMDMTLYHLDAGFGVRAIPLDLPVYSTGLVAADHLDDEVAGQVRDAFVAGHQLQRENPEVGLAGFRRRFPDISEDHVRANWKLYASYAFDGGLPGSMDPDRWQDTVAYTARTHALPSVPAEQLYRPQFAAVPAAAAAA